MLVDPGWLYRTYGEREAMKRGSLAAFAIARKDLRTELRTKESLNASALVRARDSGAVQLRLRSGPREHATPFRAACSGWSISFAGALIVNRSFAREIPNDCLDVLIASPAPGLGALSRQNDGGFFCC